MLLVAGCGKSDSKKEPKSKIIIVTDSDGQQVTFTMPAQRVVVTDSCTAEIIKGLKAETAVVGIDEYTKEKIVVGCDKNSVRMLQDCWPDTAGTVSYISRIRC